MIPVLVIFGLLGIGMVLVVFGTIAKNRWGINLDPVSCPSCNTLFPQIRQPQSMRQALWVMRVVPNVSPSNPRRDDEAVPPDC